MWHAGSLVSAPDPTLDATVGSPQRPRRPASVANRCRCRFTTPSTFSPGLGADDADDAWWHSYAPVVAQFPLPKPHPCPRHFILHPINHRRRRRRRHQPSRIRRVRLEKVSSGPTIHNHRHRPPASRKGRNYPRSDDGITGEHAEAKGCRGEDPLQVGGAGRRRRRQDRSHHPGRQAPPPPRGIIIIIGSLRPGRADRAFVPGKLCLNHFIENYDPTIEDSYRKQVSVDGQACMLEVLDTAGQEDYTALRDQWVREGEGFVLVYSITSRSSFSRIQNFHQHIQRVKGLAITTTSTTTSSTSSGPNATFLLPTSPSAMSSGPGAQAPVMLVGNKSDRGTDRDVSMQEGQALARSLGCEFVEASARNCVNVEKAFYDVVRALRRQRQQAMPRPIDLREPIPPAIAAAENVDGPVGSRNKTGKKGHRSLRCAFL